MNIENVNEIKDYIIKTYPESCLAYNYNDSYSEELLIEECEDFFYYEKLNWCGCGDPDMAKTVIRDYLEVVKAKFDSKVDFKEKFGVISVYDNRLLLCLAYALDAAGFTEHGSSISGAWLTNEGKMFLWLLEQNKDIDEDESNGCSD